MSLRLRPFFRDDYGGPENRHAYDDPDRLAFSSFNLPDVGENPEARSGANEFDFPQPEIPQDPGKHDGSSRGFEAFFHQPRRRG